MKHPHHWYIVNGIGRCTVPGCSATKDFGALQKKEKISYQFIASRELTMASIPGYRNRIQPKVTEWSHADIL